MSTTKIVLYTAILMLVCSIPIIFYGTVAYIVVHFIHKFW